MPNTKLVEARLRFLEIDESTIKKLNEAFKILEPAMDRMMDEFYDHLRKETELGEIFKNPVDMQRARLAQKKHWIEAMLRGNYDNAYFLKAEKIGKAHARIGLTPNWYIGAYSLMLSQFSEVIYSHCRDDAKRAVSLIQAVTKIVFLDLDLVIQTYLDAEKSDS